MHRTEGANNVSNLFADGPPGTELDANWANAVQEEIANVIEQSGLNLYTAQSDTRSQLWEAITRAVNSYDYIVTSPSTFVSLFERTAANTYRINSNYKSVYFKSFSGGYNLADLWTTYGDTRADIDLLSCRNLEFESGARINIGSSGSTFTVTSDASHIKNVYLKGDQSTANTTDTFTFKVDTNAENTVIENLRISHRKLNNAGTEHNVILCSATNAFAVKWIDCVVHDIIDASTFDVNCFKTCLNLSNCVTYDIETTNTGNISGFRSCIKISNGGANNFIADSGGSIIGFSFCENISSCEAKDFSAANTGDSVGFSNCKKASSCSAETLDCTAGGTVIGFSACEGLSTCYAEDLDSNTANAYGFESCNYLSACKADDIDSTAGTAEGFKNCNYGAAIYTSEATNSGNDWMDSGDAQIANQYSVDSFFT